MQRKERGHKIYSILWFRYGNFPDMVQTSRRWLSRSELSILLIVLVILAAVAFGPISAYIEKSRINRAVESARTINTLLSQYATDNNDVYPAGEGTPAAGKSEGIALNLLQNNFTPDASIFAVGSTVAYSGKAADYADLAPANMSWDFTGGADATTGITAAASEYLPIVFTTGETVDYEKAKGHGLILEPSGKGPFGQKGIVVAYKGGTALFIPAKPGAGEIAPAFIMSNFNDAGTYTQIKP